MNKKLAYHVSEPLKQSLRSVNRWYDTLQFIKSLSIFHYDSFFTKVQSFIDSHDHDPVWTPILDNIRPLLAYSDSKLSCVERLQDPNDLFRQHLISVYTTFFDAISEADTHITGYNTTTRTEIMGDFEKPQELLFSIIPSIQDVKLPIPFPTYESYIQSKIFDELMHLCTDFTLRNMDLESGTIHFIDSEGHHHDPGLILFYFQELYHFCHEHFSLLQVYSNQFSGQLNNPADVFNPTLEQYAIDVKNRTDCLNRHIEALQRILFQQLKVNERLLFIEDSYKRPFFLWALDSYSLDDVPMCLAVLVRIAGFSSHHSTAELDSESQLSKADSPLTLIFSSLESLQSISKCMNMIISTDNHSPMQYDAVLIRDYCHEYLGQLTAFLPFVQTFMKGMLPFKNLGLSKKIVKETKDSFLQSFEAFNQKIGRYYSLLNIWLRFDPSLVPATTNVNILVKELIKHGYLDSRIRLDNGRQELDGVLDSLSLNFTRESKRRYLARLDNVFKIRMMVLHNLMFLYDRFNSDEHVYHLIQYLNLKKPGDRHSFLEKLKQFVCSQESIEYRVTHLLIDAYRLFGKYKLLAEFPGSLKMGSPISKQDFCWRLINLYQNYYKKLDQKEHEQFYELNQMFIPATLGTKVEGFAHFQEPIDYLKIWSQHLSGFIADHQTKGLELMRLVHSLTLKDSPAATLKSIIVLFSELAGIDSWGDDTLKLHYFRNTLNLSDRVEMVRIVDALAQFLTHSRLSSDPEYDQLLTMIMSFSLETNGSKDSVIHLAGIMKKNLVIKGSNSHVSFDKEPSYLSQFNAVRSKISQFSEYVISFFKDPQYALGGDSDFKDACDKIRQVAQIKKSTAYKKSFNGAITSEETFYDQLNLALRYIQQWLHQKAEWSTQHKTECLQELRVIKLILLLHRKEFMDDRIMTAAQQTSFLKLKQHQVECQRRHLLMSRTVHHLDHMFGYLSLQSSVSKWQLYTKATRCYDSVLIIQKHYRGAKVRRDRALKIKLDAFICERKAAQCIQKVMKGHHTRTHYFRLLNDYKCVQAKLNIASRSLYRLFGQVPFYQIHKWQESLSKLDTFIRNIQGMDVIVPMVFKHMAIVDSTDDRQSIGECSFFDYIQGVLTEIKLDLRIRSDLLNLSQLSPENNFILAYYESLIFAKSKVLSLSMDDLRSPVDNKLSKLDTNRLFQLFDGNVKRYNAAIANVIYQFEYLRSVGYVTQHVGLPTSLKQFQTRSEELIAAIQSLIQHKKIAVADRYNRILFAYISELEQSMIHIEAIRMQICEAYDTFELR